MTLDLNPETVANLDALRKSLGDSTNTEVIRQALRLYVESRLPSAAQQVVTGSEPTANRLPSTRLLAANRKRIMAYSTALIEAFQEALGYDALHTNAPVPPLYLEDAQYKEDIKAIIRELKRLNRLLEKTTGGREKVGAAKDVEKYLHLFVSNYVPAFGKGSAYLTLAAIGALLTSMGLHFDPLKAMTHLK